jgi:NTE family protein
MAGGHGGQDDQGRGEGGAPLEVRRRSDHPAQALSVRGAERLDLSFAYRAREFGAGLGQEVGQQGAGAAVEALGQQDQSFQEVRLHTTQWPSTLHVAATDADSGVLTAFDHTCGHPLADVVSASGAVRGISPMVQFGGRTWIDGGMVSAANARLADNCARVLVIAPMPKGHAGIPSAQQDVEAMRATAKVELITPGPESVQAIGPNPYDPGPPGPVAAAGRGQGR